VDAKPARPTRPGDRFRLSDIQVPAVLPGPMPPNVYVQIELYEPRYSSYHIVWGLW